MKNITLSADGHLIELSHEETLARNVLIVAVEPGR